MYENVKYELGLNEVFCPLSELESNFQAGMHFFLLNDVLNHLNFDFENGKFVSKLAIISIPDNEYVCVDSVPYFRTTKLLIDKVLDFSDVSTWEYLRQNDIDLTGCDNIVLKYASAYGYINVIKYLYENRIDIISGIGEAVELAAKNRQLNIIQYLCEHGASVSASAMITASAKGCLDIVKLLHKYGANVNDGMGAASIHGWIEIVKYLHENGADITANNNFAVRQATNANHLEVVRYLHRNGADITADDNAALISAAGRGYLDMVKYLCENGADIMAKDCMAIKMAETNGRTEVAKYLKAQIN